MDTQVLKEKLIQEINKGEWKEEKLALLGLVSPSSYESWIKGCNFSLGGETLFVKVPPWAQSNFYAEYLTKEGYNKHILAAWNENGHKPKKVNILK